MAIIGSAHVEIHSITDKVGPEIRDGVQKGMKGQGTEAGKQFTDEFGNETNRGMSGVTSSLGGRISNAMGNSGTTAGKSFSDKFKAVVGGLAGTKIAGPNLDTKVIEARIDQLRDKLEKLRDIKANPTADIDIAVIEAKIGQVEVRLNDLRKMNASPKVTADIAYAEAQLDKLRSQLAALKRDPGTAKVDADIGAAEIAIAKLEAKLAAMTRNEHNVKVNVNDKDLTQSLIKIASLSRAIATLAIPVAAVGATPAIASLGSAAVEAAGALYLLPAALGVAAVGVGTLAAGFAHLGDALGPSGTPAQVKKVNEALASLSPQARATVVEIRGLSDEWKNLRVAVQDRMFQGVADDVAPLAATYLPMLRASMTSVAGGFNEGASSIIAFLRSTAGIELMRTGMANVTTTTTTLTGVLAPLGQALVTIFAVGSQYLNQYAVGLVAAANNFNSFISAGAKSGQLNAIIERGLGVLQDLAELAMNVGGILGSIFDAGKAGGADFLGTLVSVTGKINAFFNSAQGNDILVGVFRTINDTVTALLPGLRALGGNLAASFGNVGPILPQIAQAFSDLVVAGVPLMGLMSTLASIVLPPLVSLISAISPALGPAIVAFGLLALGASALVSALNFGKAAIASYQIMMALLSGSTTEATIAQNANSLAVAAGRVAALVAAGATAALSGAQWLLNAAFLASPIGWVVLGIAALVAGFILAYKNSETFRNIVKAAFDAVATAVGAVIDWFARLPEAIGNVVSTIGGVFSSVIGWFTQLPGMVVGALASLGSSIASAATAAWDSLVTTVSTALDAVVNFFLDLPNKIAYALGFLVGSIVKFFTQTGPAALAAVVDGFWAVIDWFRALPDRVGTYLLGLALTFAANAVAAWNSFTDGLENAWNATGAWLAALPGRFVSGLVNIGTAIGTTAVTAWDNFTAGLGIAFDATVAWFQALPGNITSYLLGLAATFTANAIAAWHGFTAGLETGWDATIAWFQALPGNIAAFFANAGTWLLSVGGNIIDGLIGGLTSAGAAVLAWFLGLADSFMQGFKDALGIASPSTMFAQFGTWILEGLIAGLQAMWAGVVALVTGLGTAILTAFQAAITFLVALWDSFWNGLTTVVQTVLGIIQAVLTMYLNFYLAIFTFIWNAISTVVTVVWTAIQAFIQTGLAAISAVWSAIWNGIQVVFSAIWNGIQAVAVAVWNAISSFLTAGIEMFRSGFVNTWHDIQTVFSAVWTFIQNIAITVWNAISAFFQAAFAAYQAAFQLIWTTIQTVFQTVWTFIQNIAITVWNAISAFFAAAFAAYQAAFAAIWNAISALFSAIWTGIQTAATTIWNAIAAFFSAAFATFQAAFDAVWNAIKTVFETVWNAIKAAAMSVWNAISSFFTTALNTFKSLWDNFWSGISTGFQRIWDGIKGMAQAAWQGINDMFRTGINVVIDGVNWPINKINDALKISIPTIPRLATGGDVHSGEGRVGGLPGRTADRTPALLSAEEHVWSGREVMGVGGHAGVRKLRKMAREGLLEGFADGGRVDPKNIPPFQPGAFIVNDKVASVAGNFLDALNRGQAEAVQATGGKYATGPTRHALGGNVLLPGFAAGGALLAAQQFAQAESGKPYIWGGVGPAGYDCSGYMSAITNVLRGQNPHQRLGVAASQPWPGFQSGMGSAFVTGFSSGHTAGTLGGVNVESGGSHGNVAYGGPAVGADSPQFPGHAFLPEIGGVFAPGGAGGLFDPGALFDSVAARLGLPESSRQFVRDIMPNSPDWLEPMGVSFHDNAWNGMRDAAIALLQMVSTLGGLLGGGSTVATGPVVDQVRAVAAQYGWDTGAEWDALSAIIQKESSWNPAATNGNAAGLFQKMTSLHGPVEDTAAGQAGWGLNYIQTKYGTPSAALAHHNQVGSYDTGGWLAPGITAAINGTGKPEAIIADPMTTFERAFKRVFNDLAPHLKDALEKGSRYEPDWARHVRDWFSGRRRGGNGPVTTPPPVVVPPLPPIEIPTVEVPPVVVPALPAEPIRASFDEVLNRMAPELSSAIEAGSADQIASFGREILGNNERLAAMSAEMGVDIAPILRKLVDSVAANPVLPGPSTGGGAQGGGIWARLQSIIARTTSGQTIGSGYNDRFQVSKWDTIGTAAKAAGQTVAQYLAANPNLARGTDPMRDFEKVVDDNLHEIPNLMNRLNNVFPEIIKAVHTSDPGDLREILGEKADELLTWLNTQSTADANKLLNALGAEPLKPGELAATAASAIGPTYNGNTSSGGVTITDGAFQVTINGNADSVTVDQLRDTLTAWSDEIVHQYEGRT